MHFPSHFDAFSKDLIKRLLTLDRTKRLGNLKGGVEDIRRHKFYKGVNFDTLLKLGVQPPIVPVVKSDGDVSNFERYEEVGIERGSGCDDPFRNLFSGF